MDPFLSVVRGILEQPTAPFHEDAVRAEIQRQLAPLSHVRVEEDAFGNLVALYRRGPAVPRYAFAAHMDHPGFVGRDFLGWVPKEYLQKKAAKRKFGAFSMWDLPAYELKAGRIYSRACDDLVGCACIVAMFQELERTGAKCAAYGLFTRAEEVGFVGAIQLAKSGLLPKETTVVSLETSSVKGGPVKMGAGVIIRVGDRTSIFDSEATAQLQDCAKAAKIEHQRSLMQGGTCEATAYALYGYRTAALCVALGNYHNCGPGTRIGSEYVSASDAKSMADLCTELAKSRPGSALRSLRQRLERRLAEQRKYFRKLNAK
jgi:putative aminopeptidase FrvX